MKAFTILLLSFFVIANSGSAQSVQDSETRMMLHNANTGSTASGGGSSSSITVTVANSDSLAQVIASSIFGGCVQISNVAWSGSLHAFGAFSDPELVTGMEYGLVMSTGLASDIPDSASHHASTSNGLPGDAFLTLIANQNTYDAAIFEFDFNPTSDTIFASDFIFGSEEYPEYVNVGYNDAFAFIISGGPDSLPETNLAMVPGTSDPISINTINDQVNSSYYIDNASGTDLVLDGITTLIPLSYPVLAGETYHFKIAIADAGDQIYDSDILIRAQSFCGNYWLQSSDFIMEPQGGLTYFFNNQSEHSTGYYWDFGDGFFSYEISPTHTYAQPGDYTVNLTASNQCQSVSSDQQLNTIVTGVEQNTISRLSVIPLANRSVRIVYEASASTHLRYEILDALGKEVSTHDIGITDHLSGMYPTDVHTAGIYFLRLWAGNRPVVRKFFVR